MPERLAPFQALQYEFTAHLRDPDRCPPPAGIEPRRMRVYRELLFKNIDSLLAGCFPVLRRITDDARWAALVRDYFSNHRARTPLFPRIPQEFLQYLDEERDPALDPPFMRELAHYEWLELEVSFDRCEITDCEVDAAADLVADLPVLNPLVRPRVYRYPVHRIAPDYQPLEAPAEPTYLVVFRDRQDEIGFMELNPVTARLVELMLKNRHATGRSLLETIAAELRHPQAEVVVAGGRAILQELFERDVVIGARRVAG